MTKMQITETDIPVPWGHVAAKIWGDQADQIVLVFHGAMDNAGSFDRLIPLLPTSFCYACIDLPGHGRSSHFPPFLPIDTINNVVAYRLVARHFAREKYAILAHSWGGQIAFLFAQLYPELVERLITLDVALLFPVPAGQVRRSLTNGFDSCIDLEEKLKTGSRPSYTYEEALRKLQDRRVSGPVTPEAVEALLQRAIEPAGDGRFFFTMDQRMKFSVNPLHDLRYMEDAFEKSPVACPVLVILARDSAIMRRRHKPIINFLRKYRNIQFRVVDGPHDVHNNDPDIVAPHVAEFLLKKMGKL